MVRLSGDRKIATRRAASLGRERSSSPYRSCPCVVSCCRIRSERRGPKRCRFLRSSVRHAAENPRAGTSSQEKPSCRRKTRGGARANEGRRIVGSGWQNPWDRRPLVDDSFVEPKGFTSLVRKEVRRSNVPRRKASRIVVRRAFHEARWKRSRSSLLKEIGEGDGMLLVKS